MNPKRICLFLLAMCVLIAPLSAASVGAEGILLIQIQDGVISYSPDGGQNWSKGVPDGAQISITMPQPAPSAPIPTPSPDAAAPQTYFIQVPVASVQSPYPMMVMPSGCRCCQQGALSASQSIANPASAIPETDADAQSEEAPEQIVPTQPEEAQSEAVQPEEAQPEEAQSEQAQPEQAQPEEAQPEQAQPEQAQPEEAQPEEVQPAPDSAEVETPSFIVPTLDLPDQSAPADATEASSFSIQIDIPEDYEPAPSAQAPSAQQSQQYVTVEPSQAVQLQPAASDPEQAPQAVATQSPAERQAMIANQTEVLLGTAANGETVWVWHDVSGNPIFSTDNGLSWSNNEPEGLVITP